MTLKINRILSALSLLTVALCAVPAAANEGDFYQEGLRDGRPGDLIIDGDIETLPSDVNFTKWARSRKDFFYSMDQDQDGVLSELDLVVFNTDKAVEFSRAVLSNTLSVWLPSINDHFRRHKADLQRVSNEDDILPKQGVVMKSIEDVFTSLDLIGQDMPAYVFPEFTDGEVGVRSDAVASDMRSWVETTVPFTLHVQHHDGDIEYPMVATILLMKKFPKYDGDDKFALWGISVSGR